MGAVQWAAPSDFQVGKPPLKAARAVHLCQGPRVSRRAMAGFDKPIDVVDPHFHFFDVREESTSGHDPKIIGPIADGKELYDKACYEAQMRTLPPELRHRGGVFLEAVSVCHPDLSGPDYSLHCLKEARFATEQLGDTDKYAVVATCALEQEDLAEMLGKLKREVPGLRGIRQIANHEPSWPRNHRLGDLLENPQWQRGFATLEGNNPSFDLQLNPHQFQKAAELLGKHPETMVIIDHLGSPLMEDLQENADQYWRGLEKLAALPGTFMKISMLSRLHPSWHEQPLVLEALHRIVRLFGPGRCMFASNAPVDGSDGWGPERVFQAFLKFSETYPREDVRELFAGTARRAYRM